MQQTIIPLSKSKLFAFVAISALFVVIGYWLFGLDAAVIEQQRKFNHPMFVHSVGFICMVFGALAFVLAVRKVFSSKPGLILDTQGITDNSSMLAAGFIPWFSIDSFEVRQIHNQRILYVILKDPEAYILRFGLLRKIAFKLNRHVAASPVGIISSSLTVGFDELVRLVEQYYLAAQQRR